MKFFDLKSQTKITCDTSKCGLVATLEQKFNNWEPIEFASQTLIIAKINYCLLDKETLPIVFACSKFHEYVYGRKFHIEDDQKPLKTILAKPISEAPPRIQHFMLILQKYDFDVNYIPGKLVILADKLSRATLKDTTQTMPKNETTTYIHSVVHHLPVSDKMLMRVKYETSLDPTMLAVLKYLFQGSPNEIYKVETLVYPDYKIQNKLSIYEGLILNGSRIVIPTALRKRMKQILHIDHLGIECTKVNARGTIHWPNRNIDIENMVANCTECQIYQNKLEKETLLQHTAPEKLWTKRQLICFIVYSELPYSCRLHIEILRSLPTSKPHQ